jgi:hypothetical protein
VRSTRYVNNNAFSEDKAVCWVDGFDRSVVENLLQNNGAYAVSALFAPSARVTIIKGYVFVSLLFENECWLAEIPTVSWPTEGWFQNRRVKIVEQKPLNEKHRTEYV